MEKTKLERINELARKSKNEGLNEAEKQEQAQLRAEYIQGFRNGLIQTMDSVVIVDKDGNERRPTRKKEPKMWVISSFLGFCFLVFFTFSFCFLVFFTIVFLLFGFLLF